MAKERSTAAKFGIAGKDVVAFMLIATGTDIAKGGDYLMGGALIAVGGVLLLIQQFV